jgi:hypothetical protein
MQRLMPHGVQCKNKQPKPRPPPSMGVEFILADTGYALSFSHQNFGSA